MKKYGKNWEKLEDAIPTRTGTQIRSHAQKFFGRIKKEFNTTDPMEYIVKNACDESKVYKFDTFLDTNPNNESFSEKRRSNSKYLLNF